MSQPAFFGFIALLWSPDNLSYSFSMRAALLKSIKTLSSDEILGCPPPFHAAPLSLLQFLIQSRPRLQLLKVKFFPRYWPWWDTIHSSWGRSVRAWPKAGLWKWQGCLKGRWDLLRCFWKLFSRTLRLCYHLLQHQADSCLIIAILNLKI